jgi:hypothetical protein
MLISRARSYPARLFRSQPQHLPHTFLDGFEVGGRQFAHSVLANPATEFELRVLIENARQWS